MNRVVIITSVVLLFCALNIGLMSSEERQKYYQRGNIVGEPPPVGVFLAAKGVARAVPLRSTDFVRAEWPAHKVPQNAIRSLNEIEDFFARRPLVSGTPLLLSDVTRKRLKLKPRRGFDSYSLLMEPKNYDERKFPVGAYVDVVDRFEDQNRVMLQKVKVLAVGKEGVFSSSSVSTKSSQIVRSGIFIELEVPEELARAATAKGEIRLRPFKAERANPMSDDESVTESEGEVMTNKKRKKKRREASGGRTKKSE
jgi:Flp pilus assembly protein CpaB